MCWHPLARRNFLWEFELVMLNDLITGQSSNLFNLTGNLNTENLKKINCQIGTSSQWYKSCLVRLFGVVFFSFLPGKAVQLHPPGSSTRPMVNTTARLMISLSARPGDTLTSWRWVARLLKCFCHFLSFDREGRPLFSRTLKGPNHERVCASFWEDLISSEELNYCTTVYEFQQLKVAVILSLIQL